MGEAAAGLAWRLALAALLLQLLVEGAGAAARPENNARLTTSYGGKKQQQQNNNNQPQQRQPTGVPCNRSSECEAYANTSCIPDSDGKRRCLCGDRSPPKNAKCQNTFKIVDFPCNADSECVENAQCILPNSTSSTESPRGMADSGMSQTMSPSTKVCKCRDGFAPDEGECSRGSVILFFSPLMLIALATIPMLRA